MCLYLFFWQMVLLKHIKVWTMIVITMDNIDPKKKRGRKKKDEIETPHIQIEIQDTTPDNGSDISVSPRMEPVAKEEEEEPSLVKKRGRKPKGGKLIYKQPEPNSAPSSVANVILHLKCSLNDLTDYNQKISKMVTNPMEYNPTIPPDILTYNGDSQAFSEYVDTDNVANDQAYQETKKPPFVCSLCKSIPEEPDLGDTEDTDIHIKDINYKLKKLKINLYKNNHSDKKSACFWCTYEFDNPACYIPKYDMDDKLFGYGSFCRPECAVAYLMKENIDDSTKFERYHLLNQIYSKIYDFKKNIKPAPNPYYLLDKFYGNLSIQEYRKLLKTEHMLLVIEKPMTRILPELHEDNDDMMMNIYGTGNRILNGLVSNTSGVYKVKRQSEKQVGPTKTSIIRDTFGMT